MLKPPNKTLHLTSAHAGLSRFNVSSAAAARELCRSRARVGLIDRRILGVTSRLDALYTFVTIDSQTVISYGVCRVLITSSAEMP